jgi:hypothetical protein
VVFRRQIDQHPISVLSLLHFEGFKNGCGTVQYGSLASAFNVYLNLP